MKYDADSLQYWKQVAPCYVYEKSTIEADCRELKQALPGFDFLYSVKANPFRPVVQTIANQGFGADAASPGEVETSLACGIQKTDIFYSAPGKSEADLRRVFGRCRIIADSLHELSLLQNIAQEKHTTEPVGLRLHPPFSMDGGKAGSSKFGIDLEQLDALRETLQNCPNLEPEGVHIHLQSQILDADWLGDYYEAVMDTACYLRDACSLSLSYINFGSGLGTVYDRMRDRPVDLNRLRERTEAIWRRNASLQARLLVETGRYVVCHAGTYLTPVLDKKRSHGVTWLIVPNGMNGFFRPAVAGLLKRAAEAVEIPAGAGNRKPGDAMEETACPGVMDRPEIPGMEPLYTGANAFTCRVLNERDEKETVSIAGNLCTSLDMVAEEITVRKAEIGDLIEISNAGSYGYTLSPLLFAGQDPPRQFLFDEADGRWETDPPRAERKDGTPCRSPKS